MKKLLCALLTLALLASCAPVLAEGVPLQCAAPLAPLDSFEKYAGFQMNEATGDWSLIANEADAMLAYLSGTTIGDTIYLYPELTGNAQTGLVVPVLNVYYLGATARQSSALSIVVDGARYDFAVSCEEARLGNNRAERMRAPLSPVGLTMLGKMRTAETVSVRLQGAGHYDATLTRRDAYASNKQRVESASLTGLNGFFAAASAIDLTAYRRWTANDAEWKRVYGFAPISEETSLSEFSVEGIELDATFGLLSRGDQGASVRALQNKLIEAGFLQGAADAAFGEGMQLAIRRAQRYYGLMVTGSADAALLHCLFHGATPLWQAASEKQIVAWSADAACDADVCYLVSDTATLSLHQFWFARAVVSAVPTDALSRREASNADNVLMIFEGTIENASHAELSFYWQLGGTLVVDGAFEYPLTAVCECDGGRQFDATLLPLAEARLIVYAELPASVARNAAHSYALKLTVGDATLSYDVAR